MTLLLAPTTAAAIIDLIAVILMVGFILLGIKRGFVKTFFMVFGGFLSLLFAALLASTTAEFLQGKYGTVTSISLWVSDGLSKLFGDTLMNTTLSAASEGALNDAGVAAWLLKIVMAIKGSAEFSLDTTLNQVIAPVFGYYITATLSFIGLYIVFRIIFFIVGEIVQKLHKFAVIGGVDKLLGGVFGFLRAVMIIEIVVMIVCAIPLGFFQNIAVAVDSSAFVKAIDAINIFDLILQAIINTNIVDVIKTVNL